MTDALDLRAARVKESVTIFQVLDAYRIPYRGDHTQQIACPFHPDRSPSARLYAPPENRVFCFTCQKGWDVIEVVRGKQACSFPEAVSWLEATFGLDPTSANLPAVVYNLLRPKKANVDDTLAMLEQRIVAARERLTLENYTKLLGAVDLVGYQFKQGKMDHAAVDALARMVMQLT